MTISALLLHELTAGGASQASASLCSLDAREGSRFETFAALPSNIKAVTVAKQFAGGAQRFVALFGPSGWGKTHLLESVTSQISRLPDVSVAATSALDWISSPGRFDAQALLLDDVQDAARTPRTRHRLKQALERRVRSGRATMLGIAGEKPSFLVRSFLPSPRDWAIESMGEPSVSERELVVRQIAANEDLYVGKPIVRLIARHLNGNGRSILGALQRLGLVKQDWCRREDVLPACGALMPYLLGRDGWDLRDEISDGVNRALSGFGLHDPTSAAHIGAYLMLFEAGLSEAEVAIFMGVPPAAVYGRAVATRDKMARVPSFAKVVGACRREAVRAFDQ